MQGHYYRPCAPLVAHPVALCRDDEPGDVCFVSGRVLDAGNRRPLPGALLDVWQANQVGSTATRTRASKASLIGGTSRCLGATLLEQVFARQRGGLWPMAAEPGPDFRWGLVLRRSKYNADGTEGSTRRQELALASHIRDRSMGRIVGVYKDVASATRKALADLSMTRR